MFAVKRRLFNVLAAVSLVLFLLSIAMWVRSDSHFDEWILNRPAQHPYVDLFSMTGDLGLVWEVPPKPNGVDTIEIDVHYWWLAVAFFCLPAAWMLNSLHRHLRARAPNRCHVCGYDLRATPERCPEC